jgi:hypothetical protein
MNAFYEHHKNNIRFHYRSLLSKINSQSDVLGYWR